MLPYSDLTLTSPSEPSSSTAGRFGCLAVSQPSPMLIPRPGWRNIPPNSPPNSPTPQVPRKRRMHGETHNTACPHAWCTGVAVKRNAFEKGCKLKYHNIWKHSWGKWQIIWHSGGRCAKEAGRQVGGETLQLPTAGQARAIGLLQNVLAGNVSRDSLSIHLVVLSVHPRAGFCNNCTVGHSGTLNS